MTHSAFQTGWNSLYRIGWPWTHCTVQCDLKLIATLLLQPLMNGDNGHGLLWPAIYVYFNKIMFKLFVEASIIFVYSLLILRFFIIFLITRIKRKTDAKEESKTQLRNKYGVSKWELPSSIFYRLNSVLGRQAEWTQKFSDIILYSCVWTLTYSHRENLTVSLVVFIL